MRRIGWFIVLILIALPGRAADRKLTVQQLKDYVAAAQHTGKSDAEVAAELSGMELSEELPPIEVGRLNGLLPGPLSTEQLYVLEARNAALPQPSENSATVAAPDAVAQDAMLAKARDWTAGVYAQLPPLTAQCMIARFQDGYATTAGAIPTQGGLDVRLINKHLDKTQFVRGIEVATVFTETAEPGENGVSAVIEEPLSPEIILREATDSGLLRFSRWESVDGLRAAVLSFEVEKKKTHSGVVYRAPVRVRKDLGIETNADLVSNSTVFNVVSKSFHHQSEYRGEVFIEPDSGAVLRTITEASFKPDDVFHLETIRTDYARLPVGGKTLVVPVRRFKITEFVPLDGGVLKKDAVLHSFVTEDFRGFQLTE